MASKKQFGQNRTILTPSKASEQTIAGGLNEFFINQCKLEEKESGISNILGSVIGVPGKKKLEELKSVKTLNESVLSAKFSKNLLDCLKSINNNIINNSTISTSISTIADEIKDLITIMLGSNPIPEKIKMVFSMDTLNAQNFESILKSLKELSVDEVSVKNIESIEQLNNFFLKLNELTKTDGVINEAILNVINTGEKIEGLQEILNKLTSLELDATAIQNVDTDAYVVSLTKLNTDLKTLGKYLDDIDSLNISEKVEKVRVHLDSLRKFYDTDVADLSASMVNHKKDLDIIEDTADDTINAVTSASKLDSKLLEKTNANIADIIDSVTMLSVMMIIGGAIFVKHPEYIRGSLLFGATISLFLLELMVPITLITNIANKKEIDKNITKVISIVSVLSLIMVIGALIMKSSDIFKEALLFGVALTAFLTLLLVPLALVVRIAKDNRLFDSLSRVNSLILLSSFMLIIGAAVIDSINIGHALLFGLTLSAFIAIVIAPFVLYSRIAKRTIDIADSINKLIITASIIMILGSFIGGNTQLLNNALHFGFTLGVFITLILTPTLIFALFKEQIAKTIKQITWYITATTIIMLIGAALASNKKFVTNALAFGGILGAFIITTLLPILLFTLIKKEAITNLVQITAFIGVCTFLILVGAYFVSSERLWGPALGFGGILMTFILGLWVPIKAWEKISKRAVNAVKELTIFVIGAAISIGIGAYIVNKYGWNALLGAALIDAFIFGVIWIVNKMNKALTPQKIAKASILMLSVAGVLLLAGVAMAVVKNSGADMKTVAMLAIMGLVVVGIGALMILIGSLATATLPIMGIAIAVLAGVSLIIISLAYSIKLIAETALLAEKVKKPEIIGTLFNAFIDGVNSIKFGTIFSLMFKLPFLTAITLMLAPGIALMAITVANLANLKVATSWNENGRPISYRQLDSSDFKKAASNINILITTLATGILQASKTLDKIDKRTLKKTLGFSAKLGKVIASIARGVSEYATLMIADEWNADGTARHYHLMNGDDFTNAANNISTIILTVGGAIARIASGKGEIKLSDGTRFSAADYMKAIQGDWLFGKSNFSKVLNASSKLGKLISNIASGISSFATMRIPYDWDSEGKPIKFRNLNQNDIDLAKNNIYDIITATAAPIIELASGEYAKYFQEATSIKFGLLGFRYSNEQSPFIQVLNGAIKIGSMMSSLATGIQGMSDLKFPTGYDNDGKPTGWVTLGDEHFDKVRENIGKIITTTITAITNLMTDNKLKPGKVEDMMEAVSPVGELISNLATGIVKMAELKFPSGYDADGKPTGYIELTSNQFILVGKNIGLVISATMSSIVNAYESVKKNYSISRLRKIFELMNPVNEIISTAADALLKIASGKIKINDKEEFITKERIEAANATVNTLFTGLFLMMNTLYESNKKMFKSSGNNSISNISAQLTELLTFIDNYSKVANTFASLENMDNVISNVSKLLDSNTGILAITLSSFDNINEDKITALEQYKEYIAALIPVFDELVNYSTAILNNKAVIDNISAYIDDSNQSLFGNIFSMIDGIINPFTNYDYSNIEATIGILYNVDQFMVSYKNILNTIIKDVSPLFNDIHNIYTNFYKDNVSVTDKVNTIITGIYSILDNISTDGSDNIFKRIFKMTSQDKMIRALNDINTNVSLYIDLVNLINSIPEVTVSNEKLNNDKLVKLFDKQNKESLYSSISSVTILSHINNKSLEKALNNIKSFNDILIALIRISAHVNSGVIQLDTFTSINANIKSIRDGIDAAGNINVKHLNNFERETESLDRFVQAVDKVNVGKVAKLNDLMNSMANLAEKMGGFNELINLIDGDLVNVLDKLTEKIDDAKKTINTAERIENERQRKLQANIDKLTKLMANPINVKVGNIGNGEDLTAGYEKIKE